MNQEERHALLSNVQITKWELSFAVCGEVLFQPQQNVRECDPDSQMPAKSISDKHPHAEHIATCEVAHGDIHTHHALEFVQTMVKWFRKNLR